MRTRILLAVLLLATTCAKGQQPRVSGIPVPSVVQHNAASNVLRNLTIAATNGLAEITIAATNDLALLQTANLNGASNVLRTFTIDTATVQTAAINAASNVLLQFSITATNDLATVQTAALNGASNVVFVVTQVASNALYSLTLAATNDLSGVLRTLLTSATNNAATTARAYTDSATNSLAGVVRAYADSATNALDITLRALIASSTNTAASTTYVNNATNDLNTVLRALIIAATNGAATTARAYTDAATNALDSTLRALITTATNNNAITGRAYTDAATNALSGVLRTLTITATNDLDTTLRAIIASAGQWVSNSTSLSTPLNVGVKTNAPQTALHVYGTARVEGPSAQILAPSGSQALPGISFAGDPDTGFWDGASDTMYLIAGGQQIGAFDTTTIYLIKPLSFGIGGGSALLYGDADGSIGQRSTTKAQSNSIYRTYTDANNYSRLKVGYDAAKTAFFIRTEEAGTGIGNDPIQINAGPYAQVANLNLLTNGNVGIGVATPLFKLSLNGDIKLTTSGDSTLRFTPPSGGMGISDNAGKLLLFNGPGSETRFAILNDGNVGIGTNAPATTLHVHGNTRLNNGNLTVMTNGVTNLFVRNDGIVSAYVVNVETNIAQMDVVMTNWVIGQRYTNTVAGGYDSRRATVSGTIVCNSAVAGNGQCSLYVEHGTAYTNKLTVAAGGVATLVNKESLTLRISPGDFFRFTDESTGTGSISFEAGTGSWVGE